MLTSKANLPNIISNLYTSYPPQIPITFKSNHHTTHNLDLLVTQPFHHHIPYSCPLSDPYQRPHHKYMYPHFSSNHHRHIFSGIIKTETIRYSRLSATIDNFNFIHHHFTLSLGSFSIDDSDGTKNISFKMNSRFFELCRVFSNLLKMSNVGKFPWSWILGGHLTQVEKDKERFVIACLCLP